MAKKEGKCPAEAETCRRLRLNFGKIHVILKDGGSEEVPKGHPPPLPMRTSKSIFKVYLLKYGGNLRRKINPDPLGS